MHLILGAASDAATDPVGELGESVSSLLAGYSTVAALAIVAAAVAVTWVVTRFVVVPVVRGAVSRTEGGWDDRFVRRGALRRTSWVPAAMVAWLAISAVPDLAEPLLLTVRRIALTVVVVSFVAGLFSAVDAVNDIYEHHDYAASRPIKGYLQLAKLVLSILGSVLVVAIVLDQSPVLLLSGFGAATAVLVVVFRTTLLSLVASVQLATGNMLRVGDWITIETLGVDGDVIDIALHTITIRNFDMTKAFVPTYKLIEEPFRNWRGMREVGGRRIMRSVSVDVRSVRELAPGEADELLAWTDLEVDRSHATTTLGLFRAYLAAWLADHEDVHHDDGFPMMVRLLEPSAWDGQPVEVYAFVRETSWEPFERIQAGVLEHVHMVLPRFGLQVFQSPTGGDVERRGAPDT